MEKTKLHITEYRGDQEIQFFGITSFKVQNHGEAVIEINTIPIYPNQTVKIIEEDGTQCDFKLAAKFTESGKMPKFKTIYKQFGDGECVDLLNQNRPYTVTFYSYEVGDVINFSQNMSGHTTLTRSYDGGQTFLPENDIDLGFVPANEVIKYDSLGSLETTSIQFRNNDLLVNSEIFTVREVNAPEGPIENPNTFQVTTNGTGYSTATTFQTNVDCDVIFMHRKQTGWSNGQAVEYPWSEYPIGFSTAFVDKEIDFSQVVGSQDVFKFRNAISGEMSEEFYTIYGR